MNNLLNKFKRQNIALFIVVAIFFSLDRYLKYLSFHKYSELTAIPLNLMGSILQFSFTKNYYIAFSLPFSGLALNILIGLVVLVLFLYIFYLILSKKSQKALIPPLTLILFGAISNLTDRLRLGYVIDYFDLSYFTVFNIADMMILGGVIIILLCYSKNQK